MKTQEYLPVCAALTIGASALGVNAQSTQGERRSRPHIILLMTDQHRADAMGCSGNPSVITPNLDRLAAEGAAVPDVIDGMSLQPLLKGEPTAWRGTLANAARSGSATARLSSGRRASSTAPTIPRRRDIHLMSDFLQGMSHL